MPRVGVRNNKLGLLACFQAGFSRFGQSMAVTADPRVFGAGIYV